MRDFMSHRTGLAPKKIVDLSMPELTCVKTKPLMVLTLSMYADFRAWWLCRKWGYAVADLVMQRLSGNGAMVLFSERMPKSLDLI